MSNFTPVTRALAVPLVGLIGQPNALKQRLTVEQRREKRTEVNAVPIPGMQVECCRALYEI